jgi:hypothetical protein
VLEDGGGGERAGRRRREAGQARARPGARFANPDQTQGFPQLNPRNQGRHHPRSAAVAVRATEEALRSPLNIIPPNQRPRVALRFADQNQLLVSGLLQGGGDIAQRPVVVDVPVDRGHVVLFANNPIWRGETIGSYGMVWNTIMNFDNLNAGRKWDAR